MNEKNFVRCLDSYPFLWEPFYPADVPAPLEFRPEEFTSIKNFLIIDFYSMHVDLLQTLLFLSIVHFFK